MIEMVGRAESISEVVRCTVAAARSFVDRLEAPPGIAAYVV